MWEPTKIEYDADGDLIAEDDCIQVCLVNIGEGCSGDYNEDDPEDINYLRFDVYYKNPESDEMEEVDDASYCTCIDAKSAKEHLEDVIKTIFNRYRDVYTHICAGGSVKHMGEELSYIS